MSPFARKVAKVGKRGQGRGLALEKGGFDRAFGSQMQEKRKQRGEGVDHRIFDHKALLPPEKTNEERTGGDGENHSIEKIKSGSPGFEEEKSSGRGSAGA